MTSVFTAPFRIAGTAFRLGKAVWAALDAVPRVAATLDEIQATAKHLERLATYASNELPELVYQLEAVRDQLTAIEKSLAVRTSAAP
ncbi:hypothetical protein [Amycolatopsis sp. CA-230715]|uniref:hypothetical protein n=1 Tax=Amycolatopsis sp. CA-230715 TaxID=2745196 RepID=UPI001C03598C|nr:hypothetical protein [Amycolatopsis sp. CA-230715]QWF84226.1 hypothetical protein HUW46_07675 [Amycolatopsis sp. CA-230715]